MNQPSLFGSTPPARAHVLNAGLRRLIATHGFDAVSQALERIRIETGGPIGSAPARHTDPRTSKAAAKTSVDVRRFGFNSHSGRLLRHFALKDDTDHDATYAVLGGANVTAFEGCRRRCSDLRAAGYIEDSGAERDGRIVWTITDTGWTAVERLEETGWSR